MMGKGTLLTHASLFVTVAKRSFRQLLTALPAIGLIAALLIVGFVSSPQTVSADTVVTEKGMPNAVVMAVNPVTNKIYVGTTATAGLPPYELKIIDAATNSLRTLTLQDNPSDIAINPVTNKIYVVSAIGHNATVINGETDAAMGTIETGYNPRGIAVNPVTNKIYVLNQYEKSVTR